MTTDANRGVAGSSGSVLRVAIALVPEAPLFSAIISASQAVTGLFQNQNIIDAERFPPHASLHICTIPTGRLEDLFRLLRSSITSPHPVLKPLHLKAGSGGYITLQLQITPEIRQLHEASIEAAAQVRGVGYVDGGKQYRKYSPEDQRNYDKYGNLYVLQKFNLHLSIAKVEIEHQGEAYDVARRALGVLSEVITSNLQICDIGMKSEKWVVLKDL